MSATSELAIALEDLDKGSGLDSGQLRLVADYVRSPSTHGDCYPPDCDVCGVHSKLLRRVRG